MKFKKRIFSWLVLAVIFSCVNIYADILEIKSIYLGFTDGSAGICTELFMPYSELSKNRLLNLIKLNEKRYSDTDLGNKRDPEIVIVVDNNNFTDKEKRYLDNYEQKLMKSGMILWLTRGADYASFEIFVKPDRLIKWAKSINFTPMQELIGEKITYELFLKKLCKQQNIGNYAFLLFHLDFPNNVDNSSTN